MVQGMGMGMGMGYSNIWKTSPENASTTRNSESSAQPVRTTPSSRGLATSLQVYWKGGSCLRHAAPLQEENLA